MAYVKISDSIVGEQLPERKIYISELLVERERLVKRVHQIDVILNNASALGIKDAVTAIKEIK